MTSRISVKTMVIGRYNGRVGFFFVNKAFSALYGITVQSQGPISNLILS